MSSDKSYEIWYADAGLVRSDRNGIAVSAVVYEENKKVYHFMIYGNRRENDETIDYFIQAPSNLNNLCCAGASSKCQKVCDIVLEFAKNSTGYIGLYRNIVMDKSEHECQCQRLN